MSKFRIQTGITPPPHKEYLGKYGEIHRAFDSLAIGEWMQVDGITKKEALSIDNLVRIRVWRMKPADFTLARQINNSDETNCLLYLGKVPKKENRKPVSVKVRSFSNGMKVSEP